MTVMDLTPDPAPAGVSPQEVVDQITGAAKSSFSLGMKLLSRPRREAMRAVYAFCRVVDDIADGHISPEEKKRMLGDWRAEVDALYAGVPRSAVGQALLRPVVEYDLPRAEFLAMIEGMEMDAAGPIVAPSDAVLSRYTRCVAGSVGLLSMRIFGAWRGEASELFALALADALQLTNILRDVEEDAAVGRIYLPREVLERVGVPIDPGAIAGAKGLSTVCEEIGGRARQHFVAARAEIPSHSRLALVPAMAMLGVYEGYLDRMQAEGFRRFDLAMSSGEKLRRGLWAAAFAGPK